MLLLGTGLASAQTGLDPFGTRQVGPQPDGSTLVPDNQFVTPAGSQIVFGGNPLSAALRPDGQTAATLNGRSDYGGNGLTVIDLATKKAIATNFSLKLDHMWGLAYSPDGKMLYATGSTGSTGTVVAMSVAPDGTPTVQNSIPLPAAGVGGNINPLDVANGPGGSLLVALNRDNSLGVVDPKTGSLTARIRVGNAPTAVTVVGNTAYVTNQGGRAAQPGDTTIDSSGTPIVVDGALGDSSTGTVSVVDLTTNTVTETIPVGLQPERMTVSGQYLFVANANSDTVSVVDTTTDAVVQTIDVRPYPNAPLGAAPNAVKVLNGNQLVVSLGRDNALAVYQWNGPSTAPRLTGLVPTAWFPDDIAVDQTHGQLLVANADGLGALGPERSHGVPYGATVTGHSSYAQEGSVSLIPFPNTADLVHGTDMVYAANNWFGINERNAPARNNKKPVALPERIGEPSTIKHVFYIIKENRTYDQVLGDLGKGNGDPSLTQFGQQVTPNFHQFANTFPTFDNFYTNAIQSAAGHQWVTQATNPDYEEKETDSANVRSYPGGNHGDALAYSSTGHLWDDATAHHLTAANFGENATDFSGPEPFGSWTDWYNDYLKLSGQQPGTPHIPVGDYKATSDLPAVNAILSQTFPTNTQSIPDQYRAQMFLDTFSGYVKNNNLPQLTTIWLPNDHTAGSAGGLPTPQAMVADNDLAVGKIVDAISHSPYWKDSAIFVTEDDSQDGVDHVDGHREPAFVISPWVKRNTVDSHYWTVVNMMRTMEQILGLPPMNQNDAAATPMSEIFTDQPDFTPYNVAPNQVPLNWLNGQPAPQQVQQPAMTAQTANLAAAWQAWTDQNRADFTGSHTAPDQANANMLNHDIWYSTKGFATPYPGDTAVLTPSQVMEQPASHAPAPADNG